LAWKASLRWRIVSRRSVLIWQSIWARTNDCKFLISGSDGSPGLKKKVKIRKQKHT
jgi:hypothetical protein